MEIKGVSQSVFYHAELSDTKKKNDPLKGISSSLDYLSQFPVPKLDKEKNFSKISLKEDIYSLDRRSVAKNISDLNAPLCDTGYGGG